jgi:hypothetical protein
MFYILWLVDIPWRMFAVSWNRDRGTLGGVVGGGMKSELFLIVAGGAFHLSLLEIDM